MGRIYYSIDGKEVIINFPIDESGRYLIEWNGKEIGQLYVSKIAEERGHHQWKGTTVDVNLLADELGKFIERSDL